MSCNKSNLARAKAAKDDEFYTLYETVSNELIHYKDELKGKVIYCNCDTDESNFVKFLNEVKEEWGIKEVIHTSLQEGVDFRSDESVEILKKCDVVISNPPFSLAREYYKQILDYGKDYIILFNLNFFSIEFVFDEIKNERAFLGKSITNGHTNFLRPDGSTKQVSTFFLQSFKYFDKPDFNFYSCEDDEEYDYFDDTNYLNVDKTREIPEIYDIIMAVPISFLYLAYNNRQFKLLGLLKRGTIYGYEKYVRILLELKKNES